MMIVNELFLNKFLILSGSKLYCKNGGILSSDKTMCYCPISKTGKECEISKYKPNICN